MNSRMLHEWVLRKKNLQHVLHLICLVPIKMEIESRKNLKYCTKNILEILLTKLKEYISTNFLLTGLKLMRAELKKSLFYAII